MYDTVEQTNLRLTSSIVIYDNRPAYVDEVGSNDFGKIYLHLRFLPKLEDSLRVCIDDPLLNIREFTLGYVNLPRISLYVTRAAGRQQKQGLAKTNMVIPMDRDGRESYSFNELLKSAGLVDCLKNKYPAFNTCVRQLESSDTLYSVAFNRRFALYHDKDLGFFEVMYRGNRIAWGEATSLTMPSNLSYLRELINELGVPIK